MSEKKKPNSAPFDERAPESDRQFLERTGVNDEVKSVITSLIENRPQDPISYLAEYFATLENQVSPVLKAYNHLNLTHYTRPIFDANLRWAYEHLSQTRVGRNLKGVNGKTFMELLEMICRNFPNSVSEKLIFKLRYRDHEAICYKSFKSSIFTCLVLQDFLQQCDDLYLSLDLLHTNKADKCLCETTLEQLKKAMSPTTITPQATSILEAGYSLAPDKMYTALNKAVSSHHGNQQFMGKDEFIQAAAESFLNKVERPR